MKSPVLQYSGVKQTFVQALHSKNNVFSTVFTLKFIKIFFTTISARYIRKRQSLSFPLSMKRYELPPPPPGRVSDLSAWQESVENSMAQLEHQAIRSMNLDLMVEYGCEAWKAYLEIFTSLQAKAQIRLQAIKKEIQEVNWQRKLKQTQAGDKLRSLEAEWVMLVSKNYEIEKVCAELEEEIAKLRSPVTSDADKTVTTNVTHVNGDQD